MKDAPYLPIHVMPVWSQGNIKCVDGAFDPMEHTLLSPDHRPEFWAEWLRTYHPAAILHAE
jgi:hypothetical protein